MPDIRLFILLRIEPLFTDLLYSYLVISKQIPPTVEDEYILHNTIDRICLLILLPCLILIISTIAK